MDKIIDSMIWNEHKYVTIQRPDGSRITIKLMDPEAKDEEALSIAQTLWEKEQAEKVATANQEPLAAKSTLTDAEIKEEVARRRLTAAYLGLTTATEAPKEIN